MTSSDVVTNRMATSEDEMMGENDTGKRDMEAFKDAAQKSSDAGIADETAALDEGMVSTESGKPAQDSEAHPS